MELVEEYILDFLQELMIAWGSCAMVLGNEFSFVAILLIGFCLNSNVSVFAVLFLSLHNAERDESSSAE